MKNNNFISKNIKEVKKANANAIANPEDILEEMRTFFQKMYSHKLINLKIQFLKIIT